MRRLIEIPALDTCDSKEAQENLPRVPSIFYTLPPYVRDVDLAREVVVISNPEKDKEIDLTGHYITDKDKMHRYEFDDGYKLPAGADVHIYCVPGKHGVDNDDEEPKHYLLWTNRDGRPRRKDVLDPSGDTVYLMDANDVEIAALEVTEDGVKRLHLQRLELLQESYAGKVVTTAQGVRLAVVVAGFTCLIVNSLSTYLALALTSTVVDLAGRASDSLRRPKSRSRVFACVADRVEAAGLLAALLVGVASPDGGFYEPNATPRVRLALGLLLIEVLASWFEALVDALLLVENAAATPFLPKAEAMSAQAGPYHKFVQKYLRARPAQWAVAAVTAGNHLYLLLAVAALAHEKEALSAGGAGLVMRAVAQAQGLLQRLPGLPAALTFGLGGSHALVLTVGLAAVYRVLLMWAALMDCLDAKL